MNRREALVTVAAIAATLRGEPVAGSQGPALIVPFDGLEAIVLRYRGQQIVINPGEIMAALSPQQQYPQQFRR